MKAISFLGIGKYEDATYVYQEKGHTTRFFPTAIPVFFPDVQTLYLFVTPTVQKHDNFQAVRDLLPSPPLKSVSIPEGHSEAELWEIFRILTDVVQEGDEVVFDITHSFRSLPFLTFLAAAYLRAARRVTVRAVIYGAYEARPKEDSGPRPVFDLTPFVYLLDWLAAANEFIYTGNARFLARLLEQEGRNRCQSSLKRAGETLAEFSQAIMLCRPIEVMEGAGKLEKVLRGARDDMAQWARPFEVMADRIVGEYGRYALPAPTAPENVAESLRRQLDLIRRYLERNQVIQGVTLAREWLVTAVGWRKGKGFALALAEREEIERGISGVAKLHRRELSEDFLNEVGKWLNEQEERDRVRGLWDHLSGVRNDLDHAGMSPGRMPAARLQRKAQEEILPRLEELAQVWGLIGGKP
jgi:CRISPR-associated DxTHG motif protein